MGMILFNCTSDLGDIIYAINGNGTVKSFPERPYINEHIYEYIVVANKSFTWEGKTTCNHISIKKASHIECAMFGYCFYVQLID